MTLKQPWYSIGRKSNAVVHLFFPSRSNFSSVCTHSHVDSYREGKLCEKHKYPLDPDLIYNFV